MFMKQCPLLFVILVVRTINTQRFDVVSTTAQPSHNGLNQKHSSDSYPGLKENNYRLLALELQNVKFQNSMEKQCKVDADKLEKSQNDFNTKFENQISTLLKMEQQCKLDADKQVKSQKDITTRFENIENQISTLLKAIKGLDTKLGNTKDTIVETINTKLQEQIEKKLNTTTHHHTEKKASKDCVGVMEEGDRSSGVYTITLPSGDIAEVYCDMDTQGGGWLYVLRRVNGSQDFQLPWKNYKEGFGNVTNEFWLGLELLRQLTSSKPAELLINLVDWDGKKVRAFYKQFQIGSEKEGYVLRVIEGYDGDAKDALSVLKNMKFSTHDKDQDDAPSTNCAQSFKGGWWFKNCYINGSKLTGIYLTDTSKSFKSEGIHWLPLHHGSLKEVKMMIRPSTN